MRLATFSGSKHDLLLETKFLAELNNRSLGMLVAVMQSVFRARFERSTLILSPEAEVHRNQE